MSTAVLIAVCPEGHLTRVEREWREGVVKAGPRKGQPCRDLIGGYTVDVCGECGRFTTKTAEARVSKVRCGAKCVNATGPACSCECGGKSHGGRGC